MYDEHGRRVDETCTRRGAGLTEIHPCPPEQIAIPSRVRRIDQPVVYCGRMRAHWGHFLTESISRLWVLSGCDVPVDARLLFHRSKRRAEDFVHRFFDHAGVDRARFLDLDSPTTLLDVYVPEPTFALGGLAFSGHVTLPERVATAICGEAPSRRDQPIYLSRGRLAGAREARIEGESRLEEVLAKRGVKIVAPETLPYEKQVRLFNRYSIFIGCIGSAFHSLLYALPDRKPQTAVIASAIGYYEPGYYPDHLMIDALKCVRANYLYEPGDPSQPLEKATLDPGAAIRFLEDLSVI